MKMATRDLIGGIALALIVAALMWQEVIPSSAGVAFIFGIAGALGLYERGLGKPQR